MSRLPVDVAEGAHGGIQLRIAEADAGWEVIEQVVRWIDRATFDEITAAIEEKDHRTLDGLKEEIGKVPLKVLHLSKAEALALATALLAVTQQAVSA